MLSIERSADVLLILIIGGTGYLYGGLVGALIYRLLQDYLSDLTARYWQFWIGLLLVAIVLVGRERIGGWTRFVEKQVTRLFRRPAPTSPADRGA
jgi:branched-chain amino acid transport system permease protein